MPRLRRLPDLAAGFVLALALACGGDPAPPPSPGPAVAPILSVDSRSVTLLYPGGEDGALQPCEDNLPLTGDPDGDYALLVARYLAGPACEGLVNPFPEGAGLRALYPMARGLVVVDLTSHATSGAGGAFETLRVYGLIDTLALNFPEVRSVRILVEGREVESLLGHLDLQRPLVPEPSFAAPEVRARLSGVSP